MKKLIILILLFIAFKADAQKTIKKYVQENISSIKNIEPDSLDFSDLEVIGKAIGNSRIVMLGEQDHGDAPTFLAKTRLIKYLHEKKGFDVLAFESDFFALNEGWDNLIKDEIKIDTFLSQNIFSIWTNAKECSNLFYNYIPASYVGKNPLIITGFDSQVHGKYSGNLKKYIADLLIKNDISFIKSKAFESTFLSFIDSTGISKDLDKHRLFISQIDTILKQLPKKLEGSFELLVLHNLQENSKSGISYLTKGKDYMEIRDKQMAENLKWLVNFKYPNQKIIVWAHNGHILKNKNLIKPVYNNENWTNMGSYLAEDTAFIKQTYILGFNSKQGTAGRITISKTYTVSQVKKNSFEDWVGKSSRYAFLDFKKFRELNPNSINYFNMKGNHHSYNEAIWTNVFDGIFYIRDMYPAEQIK